MRTKTLLGGSSTVGLLFSPSMRRTPCGAGSHVCGGGGPRQFQQRGRKEGRYLRNVNTGGGDDNATSGPEASVKKRTNPFELAVLMKN